MHSATDPYSQTPYSRRKPGGGKAAFIFSMFFILQGAFSSLWTQKRDLHRWSCAVLTGLATGIRTRVTEAGSECVFVHLCSLMSANHSCSLFTTYALSNIHTDTHTLIICCVPVLKADKHVVILQVKDNPQWGCECAFLSSICGKCARDNPCKCEHTHLYIATCSTASKNMRIRVYTHVLGRFNFPHPSFFFWSRIQGSLGHSPLAAVCPSIRRIINEYQQIRIVFLNQEVLQSLMNALKPFP